MYGGDEVSALVLDIGRSTVKAGWAGEDTPKALFPSCAGVTLSGPSGTVGAGAMEIDAGADKETRQRNYFIGSSSLGKRRDDMEIVHAIEDGQIKDWDVLEKLIDHAFKDRMQIAPEVCPIMIADPGSNSNPGRERLVQLMFEKYNVPAVFLARSAVLSAFSCGRATALVVDSGGGNTSVTPVHDGYVLQKGIVRSSVSGELLTDYMMALLERKGTVVRPRFTFNKSMGRLGSGEFTVTDATGIEKTTESYARFSKRAIVADIKESLCRTAESILNASVLTDESQVVSYELPDGKLVQVGSERRTIPEAIFNPSSIPLEFAPIFGGSLDHLQPLHDMVRSSVNSLDVDIRKDMYGSVVITGGNTLFPNFKERLEKDLQDRVTQTTKVKVISPATAAERRFGVWIGGSILASLGSFQQMWISKQQYKEHGPSLVHKKCP